MKNRWFIFTLLLLLAALFIGTAAVYPRLPDPMVSHWNAAGEPDDTMSRLWGAWSVPLLTLGLTALFLAIPTIDPWGKNFQAFRGPYQGFVLFFVLFMAAMQAIVLAWNLGYPLPVAKMVPLGVAALFLSIGYLLPRAQPNWFVGIRTPWTLTNPQVWQRTHRAAGTAFTLMALLIALSVLLPPRWSFLIVLLGVLGLSLGLVVYSYVLYSRERDRD